ncbi:MAG: hypothetical protein K2G86_02945 [Prevotella sp.]|nr:hypothetical protein [Prevotella sp.]
MKTLKNLLTAATLMPLFAACIGSETEQAGFSTVAFTVPYANSTDGMIAFVTYGKWHITQNSGKNWCNIKTMEGEANMIYNIPFTATINTTGEARNASFTLQDNANEDVKINFQLYQYATRGDGTLGNAAMIRRIEGTDGSLITAGYDDLYRPTSLTIEKNGTTLRNLEISYSDASDSTVTVNSTRTGTTAPTTLKSKYDMGYQPVKLISSTDTVCYREQGFVYGSSSYAFNVEERYQGGEYTIQALKLNSQQSLAPDGKHVSDSLRYMHRYADGTVMMEKLKLTYSSRDNRQQSLDINQLLLGVEECNPYTLISMFKHARNSSVISEAESEDSRLTVKTTANADGSVGTMTVTRTPLGKDGGEEKTVTYTFSY